MSRLQSFPIAGGAYKDDTLPWSAQDTVNWIPVIAEQPGTTSPILLRGVPGYSPIYSPLQTAGLPVRGGYDADGFGVVVIGQRLYKFDGTDNLLDLGTIPGIQRVSFSHNQVAGGVQIAIANGTGGYVYDTSNSNFQQITDDAFPGARTFGYLDSYIIGVEPGGNYWFVSALADATSYSTLDRYQAESEPDRIMTALVSHSDVVILGARTTEFWFDAGTQTDTFQRRDGTGFEIGCSSSFAAVNLDNTVYWRANDGSAYRLAGYTPERISTGPVEQAWARCDPSQCYAMTYVDRGHKIVYFTHPDGQTFGFDAATQLWHRRQSYRMNRWRPSCLFNYGGKWYAGDFTNGSIALLDWGWNTENGQPLIAERSTTVIQDDRNRFRLNAVEVLFNSQKSKPSQYSLSISGDMPDASVGDTADFQYAISASAPPVTVAITSGALPTGTSIDGKGHVTGEFTTSGAYTWTATVTDANGKPASVNDGCTVYDAGVACGIANSYGGGQAFPNQILVTLGSSTGSITLKYATGPNPDKLEVWIGGVKVADTGYHGSPAQVNPATGNTYQTDLSAYLAAHSLPDETITQIPGPPDVVDANTQYANNPETLVIPKTTNDTVAVVKIYSPLGDTIWKFSLSCPA